MWSSRVTLPWDEPVAPSLLHTSYSIYMKKSQWACLNMAYLGIPGETFFLCWPSFCLWHCLKNTRWCVSCPPWVREEGTPNIYRAFQKMTQSPLIAQGRKQSSINYCDHIGIGTIWQKHTHKEKSTNRDLFLQPRGVPYENPGQSGRAITFMFWGGVSSFYWMELACLGYCGNWMLPTKKEKLIGSCTEVFLLHLKVLFALWWGDGTPFFFFELEKKQELLNNYLKRTLFSLEPHFWSSLLADQGVIWIPSFHWFF